MADNLVDPSVPGADLSAGNPGADVPLKREPRSSGGNGLDDEEDDDDDRKSGRERRKIEIKFIPDKSRRHITFSKRKAGIMKKAYELSVLTGTQVLLLVVSETGLVYTFTTPKLQPLVTKPEGKNLIQACLNAPEEPAPGAGANGGVDSHDVDDAHLAAAQLPPHLAGAPPHMLQQPGPPPPHGMAGLPGQPGVVRGGQQQQQQQQVPIQPGLPPNVYVQQDPNQGGPGAVATAYPYGMPMPPQGQGGQGQQGQPRYMGAHMGGQHPGQGH